jgi:nicotinate-nucleotide adenylyltransferase
MGKYINNNRTAIFGGTFDPPHKGHFKLATSIINDDYADKVLFVPAFQAPHKVGIESSAFLHRKNMLQLALNALGNSKFSLSDIEYRRRPAESYTFETLTELSRLNPCQQYILLIGADNLFTFHLWYNASELLNTWDILTYPRRGFEDLSTIFEHWDKCTADKLCSSLLPYPFFDISSTEIRQYLKEKKNIHSELLSETFEYIKQNNLYDIN